MLTTHEEIAVALAHGYAKAKGRPGDLLDNALRANVAIGVGTLRGLQPIVAPAVKRGQVKVVGAMYDLRTGSVTLTA